MEQALRKASSIPWGLKKRNEMKLELMIEPKYLSAHIPPDLTFTHQSQSAQPWKNNTTAPPSSAPTRF